MSPEPRGRLIAVTGASGNVGREVVRELLARGERVRALGTRPDELQRLFGPGVEVARLEFGNAETYPAAFAGVTHLFLMRPPQITRVERLLHPAVDAARAAGTRRVVFLSLQGVEKNPVVPHAKTEEYLRESGAAYTMLRPGFFMQNLSTTHRQDIAEGELLVPAGHGCTGFVDVRDVAAVAVLALTEEGHVGQAYELTGSGALTYGEVADTFTRELGRPVVYRDPSPLRFWRAMRARGHPPGFILVMLALYTVCRLGLAGRVTNEVERLLGRPPLTLAQFVRDHREVWSVAEMKGVADKDAAEQGVVERGASGRRNGREVAPGVEWVPLSIVNAYLLDAPQSGGRSGFVLVDTGLPNTAPQLLEAVRGRYGAEAEPLAIVLTHGHGDHVGGLTTLYPDVPIYAHPAELPFLTGERQYPPPQGGPLAFVMRLMPNRGPNLRGRVRPLPEGGAVPFLPEWRWLPTPGHTPGHISLFREEDRTLIAGDAVSTAASMLPFPARPPQVTPPLPMMTPDPATQAQTQRALADLNPGLLAAGHGTPMRGLEMRRQLGLLAGGERQEAASPRRSPLLLLGVAALGVLFLARRRAR